MQNAAFKQIIISRSFYEIYASMSRICVLFFYFFRFKFLSQFTQKSIENPLDSSNQRFLNRVLFVTMPFQNTAMYFLDMPGRISFVTKFLGHFKHAKLYLSMCCRVVFHNTFSFKTLFAFVTF